MDKFEQCRVCADSVDNTKPLFEGNLRKLLPKIKDITGLQLKNLKDLPQSICKSCEKQILQAHKFRTRCIRAQKRLELRCDQNDEETLKSKKKRKSQNSTKIKEEAPSIEEVLCIETDEFKAEEKNVEAAEDKDVLPKQEPTTSNSDDNSNDSSNNSRDEDMLVIESPEICLVSNESAGGNATELNTQKKTKPKEQNFICDQCGQHFTVKPYFKMHMLRHSGIKPYPCKLCSKAYYASKGLKHHMLTHTGEKPFPCKFCERRFNSRSHLVLHTRSEHTNERPFVCDKCPKSFISNNNFKAHMVTHSAVRAFVCKLCNVSYKRQNHLSRHYSSVMHKDHERKQETDCNIKQVYSNIC